MTRVQKIKIGAILFPLTMLSLTLNGCSSPLPAPAPVVSTEQKILDVQNDKTIPADIKPAVIAKIKSDAAMNAKAQTKPER